MSLIQEVLVQSNQSNFDKSGTKNTVSFNIPQDNYDLSQSYIQINVNNLYTSTEAVTGGSGGTDDDAIFDSAITYSGSTDTAYDFLISNNGTQYIRNAEMFHDGGLIESAINNDVFRGNMQGTLWNDQMQQNVSNNGGVLLSRSKGQVMHQPIHILNGFNDDSQTPRDSLIKIYLRDVLGMAQISNYNSERFGDLTLKLEMSFQRLTAASIPPPINANYNDGRDTNNAAAMNAFEDVTGSATDATPVQSLVSKVSYKDKQHPYWVGMKLNVVATNDTTVITPQPVVKIDSITQADTGVITINFTYAFATIVADATPKTLNTISLVQLAPTSTTMEIKDINLNLFRFTSPQPVPKQIQFNYFSQIRDTFPSGSRLNSSYHIPPNSVNCYIMFPEPGHVYSKDIINSYRVSINNEPLTNHDITYNSPIHNNLITSTSLNSGQLEVKNLLSSLKNFNFNNGDGFNNQKQLFVLSFPVPISSTNQLLELSVDGTLGGQIQLNFERVKVM